MKAPIRRLLLVGAALVVAGAATSIVVNAAAERMEGDSPCPSLTRNARPLAFHLTPGLEEHQSWIEFVVPEPDATAFVLCLDGQIYSQGGGHTPENNRVRVNVHTTWVNLRWVLGQLSSYERPGRWLLQYCLYREPCS